MKERIKPEKLLPYIVIGLVILACASVGCPIRALFGVSCPGCGMTRATVCAAKLDFAGAFQYNPAVFSLPLFALLFIIFRKKRKAVYIILFVFCLLLVAVYVYRIVSGVSSDVVYFCPEKGLIYKTIRSVFNVNQ